MMYWPNALDALAPEHGVVDGIKPVFFSGWDADNVRYESFLFGAAGAQIEFGAQQCILVRSDSARERLRKQIGDIGLILTLYESKGLEFNDVMLFNFFEDSTVDVSAWRVVLNALNAQQREGEPAPDFNDTKHAGVCSELKFLYVAVTRARKNLWIVDRSERGVPMRTYWMAHNLVQHYTPGSDTELPQLAVASTPEEWGKTARTLFDNKRYFQAMHAYDRAEMPRERAASYAYYLREQAHSTLASKVSGSSDPRRLAYIAAAEAFVNSAQVAQRERREYYRIAATLYVAVDDHAKAGDAYSEARMFTEAAQSYRKAGLFDKTVDVLLAHRPPDMDAIVWDRLRGVSRIYYFKQHDLQRASQLFDSVEEKLEFTEEYDLDDVRAELLEDAGRFSEAADLLMQEGRTMEAVDLYLRDEFSPGSLDKAKDCLLECLWSRLSFGVAPDPVNKTAFTSLKALFDRLKRLQQAASHLDQRSRAEVEVFLAVERQDVGVLRALGVSLANLGSTYRDLALLCLDHGFKNTHKLLTGKGDQVINTLAAYLVYVRFLSSAFYHKEPWADRSLQRLFGLSVTDDGLVRLTKDSFLYAGHLRFNHADPDDVLVIPEATLRSLYRRALAHRMQLGVEAVNRQCLEARSFEPCERNATGYCEPGNNCEWEHQLDQTWFNRRLRFYLLQGFMLNAYHDVVVAINGNRSIVSGSQAQKDVQLWLGRVEEVFFPIHHSFGSVSSIATKHISELELKRGLALVKKCIQAFLYETKPQDATANRKGFTSAVMVAFNLGFMLDKAEISSYLPEQRLVAPTRPLAPYLSRLGEKNILADLMEFYRCKESWSLQSGLVFIRRIVLQQVPIDVRNLCAFLDRLCNFAIFARRLSLPRFTLHNLTLPRSWILASLTDLEILRGKDIRGLGYAIVDLASVLLKQLHLQFEADYLFYNSRSIKDISQRQRSMVIARLCRCISLFGYNMNNFDLQRQIVRAITGLKGLGPVPSAIYNQYVSAPDWNRLGRVAVSSMHNSSLDEMIFLYDIESRSNASTNNRVRRINFKTLDDVYSLLGSNAKPPSTLRPEATPFVPAVAATSSTVSDTAANVPIEDESHLEDTETMQEDVADIVDSMQPTVSSGISPEESLRRSNAALVFAKVYRRQLRRKARHILQGVPSARSEKIAACFKEDTHIEWSSTSLYRLIFRGPLPHALTCVDRLLYKAQNDKNRVKIKARIAQHEELEKFMAEQTRISAYVKELLNLQKTLAPSSALHRAKDLAQLRPVVERVCALVDELALTELHSDRDLAYRGIVQEAAPPKTKATLKPSLNTSDIHGLDEYGDDDREDVDSGFGSVEDEQRMSE
ncbi:hypothetical protein PENSPDRAFT_693623 [Peniophora sp. CONT]|nr:hypothetical protein PENSPDRAFT_693623 [Peniophora sp. CONT]